ncbi:MAG: toprim domain-containing protein [Mycoplasma sp.]
MKQITTQELIIEIQKIPFIDFMKVIFDKYNLNYETKNTGISAFSPFRQENNKSFSAKTTGEYTDWGGNNIKGKGHKSFLFNFFKESYLIDQKQKNKFTNNFNIYNEVISLFPNELGGFKLYEYNSLNPTYLSIIKDIKDNSTDSFNLQTKTFLKQKYNDQIFFSFFNETIDSFSNELIDKKILFWNNNGNEILLSFFTEKESNGKKFPIIKTIQPTSITKCFISNFLNNIDNIESNSLVEILPLIPSLYVENKKNTIYIPIENFFSLEKDNFLSIEQLNLLKNKNISLNIKYKNIPINTKINNLLLTKIDNLNIPLFLNDKPISSNSFNSELFIFYNNNFKDVFPYDQSLLNIQNNNTNNNNINQKIEMLFPDFKAQRIQNVYEKFVEHTNNSFSNEIKNDNSELKKYLKNRKYDNDYLNDLNRIFSFGFSNKEIIKKMLVDFDIETLLESKLIKPAFVDLDYRKAAKNLTEKEYSFLKNNNSKLLQDFIIIPEIINNEKRYWIYQPTFDNNLIIPTFDENKKPTTFVGRNFLEPNKPKYVYLSTIQTPTNFNSKNRNLYNIDKINNTNEIWLTEGQLDAISINHFSNKKNQTIALGGVELSIFQIEKLKQKGIKKIILALDNDNSGITNIMNIGQTLSKEGFDVEVATFPENCNYKDFDELLTNDNNHNITTIPLLLFYISQNQKVFENIDSFPKFQNIYNELKFLIKNDKKLIDIFLNTLPKKKENLIIKKVFKNNF